MTASSNHPSAWKVVLTCIKLICCRTEGSKKKPPIYKVMLHNDNYNRREYVVKVLLKTVEGLTVDDAVNCMQVGCEAFGSSSSTVTVTASGDSGCAQQAWFRQANGATSSGVGALSVGAISVPAATTSATSYCCGAPAASPVVGLRPCWTHVCRAHQQTAAVVALQEAHETGVAMVTACAQDKAETYVETLRLNGIIASMEPGH